MQDTVRTHGTRWAAGLLALAMLIIFYFNGEFQGLKHAEAMDHAQVARHLARGEGFTTSVLRPLEIWMTQRVVGKDATEVLPLQPVDPARQPDLHHAPLYPAVLAGLFKVTGQSFTYDTERGLQGGVYTPEKVMSLAGIALMLGTVVLVFRLTGMMFDRRVAWLAGALAIVTDLSWQFALSGLCTALLGLLLVLAAMAWHRALLVEETEASSTASLRWVALAAGVQALLVLTRYDWWWTWLPSVALASLAFRRRLAASLIAAGILLVVPGLWFARNLGATGNPLGSALYSLFEGTPYYPNADIWGVLHPDFGKITPRMVTHKISDNVQHWFAHFSAYSGGLVVVVLAAGSLLHSFRRRHAQLLKLWLVGVAVAVLFGSSLGPGREVDPLRQDNNLIVLAPLLAVFAAAFLWILIDRMELRLAIARQVLVGGLVLLHAVPLIGTLLPPAAGVPYPPYYPALVNGALQFFPREDVSASDLPEAVAWYSDRPALQLPTRLREYYELSDFCFPGRITSALIGPGLLDSRIQTDMRGGRATEFASLITTGAVPPLFPLRAGLLIPPDRAYYLLLADRPRWNEPARPSGP